VREFGDQVDSSGGVENWLLLTDPKGANERFAPGRVRVTFLSASRKKKFSIVLKLPIIPTHATMALPLVECAGPFDAEEGVWKYSYKRLDRNFEDVEFYEQEGGIAREHQNEITPSSESATSKIKLTFEPRTVGTSPSALALTMALGRVEILGGDDGASISDKDIVGTLSPEDEAYLEQNFTLDAYERVAVEIVEHANTQDFEDRLNANLMLEILRLRLRLTSKFRDAKFTNLRNVDPEKLDPTTMLRTRRARRILENLRLQKENPVKHSAVGNATNASQSVGNVSLKSSTTDKTTSGATYFPEEAQTMSRSKTPILGGALTSSASLTSVATAAASKFAGFANSIANTAGSKLSGSLKDSTAAMEGLSISNKNETGRGDSIHSGGGGGSHSSPEKMVSHNIVPISPVLVEKKRLDDENERRVLTKLSVLRDLAISLDESADVLSHSASFGNASAREFRKSLINLHPRACERHKERRHGRSYPRRIEIALESEERTRERRRGRDSRRRSLFDSSRTSHLLCGCVHRDERIVEETTQRTGFTIDFITITNDIIANDRSRRVQIHAASDPRPFLYFLLLFLSLLVPPRLLLPKRNLRRRRAHRRLPHPASKKRAANATRVRFRRRPEIRVRVRLRVGVRGRRLLLRKSNDLSQLTLESANVSVRAR